MPSQTVVRHHAVCLEKGKAEVKVMETGSNRKINTFLFFAGGFLLHDLLYSMAAVVRGSCPAGIQKTKLRVVAPLETSAYCRYYRSRIICVAATPPLRRGH